MTNILDNPYHARTRYKIVRNHADLRKRLETYRPDKRVVVVKGVYDILHTGHYYSFVNAKAHGDILVVAVNSDDAVRRRKGPDRPIISEDDRTIMVAAISCVDWVTLYSQESPYQLLKILRPDVFAASHFESLRPTHRQELQEYVIFRTVPKMGSSSTTAIVNKIQSL